jgi:formylglycine-generating enzyme required for sulfatase activity
MRPFIIKSIVVAFFASLALFFSSNCGGSGGGGGGGNSPPPVVCTDADGDLHGTGCTLGPDCDDTNTNAWDTCATCVDTDADGWYLLCNTYTGTNGPDCDDTNTNAWDTCATCVDTDADGWYIGCNRYQTINGPDCSDTNTNAWDTCATCHDGDGDGWRELCNRYVGINGPDCDDADDLTYPGALEVCNDGLDNQCPGDVGFGQIDEDCVVPITAGCFNMGDSFSEGYAYELPVHYVCITSNYYIDVHEVTNAEYAVCVSDGGCTTPQRSGSWSRTSYYGHRTYNNFPVIYVSWNQATAYCTWAGKRLPTEAEWEYAARGGLSGKRYPWGDTINGTDANYWGSGDPWDNDTSSVKYYAPNGNGLYDVSGNVWEWVNDKWSDTYYSTRPNPDNDPTGPASGTNRVIRGGGWGGGSDLRVAHRAGNNPLYDPSAQGDDIGFRCAAD